MAKFYATDKLEKKRPKRRPGVHKKNVNKRNKPKTYFGQIPWIGFAQNGQAFHFYW